MKGYFTLPEQQCPAVSPECRLYGYPERAEPVRPRLFPFPPADRYVPVPSLVVPFDFLYSCSIVSSSVFVRLVWLVSSLTWLRTCPKSCAMQRRKSDPTPDQGRHHSCTVNNRTEVTTDHGSMATSLFGLIHFRRLLKKKSMEYVLYRPFTVYKKAGPRRNRLLMSITNNAPSCSSLTETTRVTSCGGCGHIADYFPTLV